MIPWDNIANQVADRLAVARFSAKDFTDVDVRRLAGSLYDIKSRAGGVLEKLDDLQFDEDARYITLAELRNTDLDDGTSIGHSLEMIEQATSAFRY